MKKSALSCFLIWAKNPTEFKRSLTRQLILDKLEGHQGKCEQKCIPAQLHIHLVEGCRIKTYSTLMTWNERRSRLTKNKSLSI